MGDTWMKLSVKETSRKVVTKVEGEPTIENIQHEHCCFCYSIEVELVGVYGTWNMFGLFKGVCKECLDKLNILMEKGDLYDNNGKLYNKKD